MVCHSSSISGGAEDEFIRLIKHFSENNKYEVFTACPEGERTGEFSKYAKKNYPYQWGWFPVAGEGITAYAKYFFKGFFQIIQFQKIFKKQNFDLCVMNVCVLFWPSLVAKLNGQKSVIFIRETILPLRLRKLYYYFLKKMGVFFIAVSEFNLVDFKSITGKKNIELLYSAVEDDPLPQYNAEAVERILGRLCTGENESRFNILHIGPVSSRKNQTMTLRVADYLVNSEHQYDIRFYFIGDNHTDKSAVRKNLQFIANKNLQNYCHFTGVLDKESLHQLYLYAHAVVIPSLSEGLPLTLVDAFKFKRPVLASDRGGMKDVISNELNGFIINDQSEITYGKILLLLKNDSSLYAKITKNAFETYMKKFNLKKNMYRLEKIIGELSSSN